MAAAADLMLGILAAAAAGLTGLVTAPTRHLWRRPRRRAVLLAPLCLACGLAGINVLAIQDPATGLLFALACGAAGSAASLDLSIRRVHDSNALVIGLSGLAHAALSTAWGPALFSCLASVAILGLAGLLTSLRRQTVTLGHGDILFAGACGLWISPELLAPALLTAVVSTVVLSRPWRADAPVRLAFVPGLALGYGAAAAAAQLM